MAVRPPSRPRGDVLNGVRGECRLVDVDVVLALPRDLEVAVGGHLEPLVLAGRPGLLRARTVLGECREVRLAVLDDLDEYLYEALRAGAGGFLLKDAPPTQLLHGIRTVATGAALLDPDVTRQLVGRYAERVRPTTTTAPPETSLTPRELEVLRLIATGLSNGEIATTPVISPETVKAFVSRILTKLQLRDRVQAVVYAYRNRLTS
jgi:DNA-binding NarL/FixJ family response regulator